MTRTSDPWREVVADWQGGTAYIAKNAAGGEVEIGVLDGGKQRLSAMELLLAGVAGCTGADVASILEKMRQPVEKITLQVRGKKADTHPKVFTEIEVKYLVWGDGLDPQSVDQAIQLSINKYCSASAMLKAVAKVKTSYQIFSIDEQLEPQLSTGE